MKDIRGKKVLVTGGARGMGLLYRDAFLADGADVVVWDQDGTCLKASVAELDAETLARVKTRTVDVTDFRALKEAYAEDFPGGIDVVVNNAGIVHAGSFTDVDPLLQAKILDVNLKSVMWIMSLALEDMKKRGSGHILNMVSAAGFLGTPYMGPYNASKWGVVGLTESVRLEMEEAGYRNIRFTMICPSYVNTGMFDGVKAPLLTPLLDPEKFVRKAYKAFKKDKYMLHEPFIVKTIPWLRGNLHYRAFDFIARTLGVTRSMQHWTGRK